ncbi:MAG TPA: hypothetical protein VFT69_00615 [Pseudolabrys sp.]|nr:hypothetical protein [Pseudolabrys sp.]
MQYVIYFLVATPLVLAWLFWAAAVTPPQPPMFNTGYNNLQAATVSPAAHEIKKIADSSSNRKG